MRIKVNLDKYKKEEKESGVRLNKYFSDLGIYSRREADKLIEEKKIHINDKVAKLGDKIKEGDSLFINSQKKDFKYFVYNKKRGEETKYKIINDVRYEPIGRLDKESEGLLIYSNDFRIVEKLLNPENKIEREYVVVIREKATPRVKEILGRGIYVEEKINLKNRKVKNIQYEKAKSVKIEEENKNIINIVLTEGKKHEIRRMFNALHLTIISLKRIRFSFLKLQRLKSGEIRPLKSEEEEKLLKIL